LEKKEEQRGPISKNCLFALRFASPQQKPNMKRLATSINSTSNQQSDNSNKIAKVDVDTFMEQHGHKNLSPALAEFLLSQSRLHDQERIRQK
jgi:sulfite reductase alpha subunit-like flavoprotein